MWSTFKKEISEIAERTAKRQLAKMNNKITALKQDIRELEQNDELDTNENQQSNVALLQHEIRHLENKKNKNMRAQAQARWQNKGEKINKYWIKLQTPKRPREIIYSLHDPTKNRLTTRSSEMARIVHDHHENLQHKELLNHDNPDRQATIIQALTQIPDQQKLNKDDTEMHHPITYDQTATALLSSKNGTATGIDGLPYELWKTIHDKHRMLEKQNKPSFDIVGCMTKVFKNIQINGTEEETNFSFGWMCPLYKKKDRTKIENYRPITLLNMDYKTMTKALAMQLATHIGKLLHPDQSGFVPNRSIFDPIRLAETMIAYADYTEENGAIVALDQEKAYDKIDHKYLIDTLKTFKLPNIFTETVASLYKHARTSVIINGVLSEPYLVTRGVRQGDPLSCLLFDLAIEPLAAMIHNTQKITGYDIPGSNTTVKINLYADDTTVYLSASDKYSDLEKLLTVWCKASGAKFNLEKTEIIPIGSTAHRERVYNSRKLHEEEAPLRREIRITKDSEPTRVLGAWIGNKVDQTQPWSPIIDKIQERLKQWAVANPTLDTKRLIIQMIVGGMTQFLTKAQGMPGTIMKTIQSVIRSFIWNSDRSPPGLGLQQLMKPKKEGGINLLDIETRNQVIELTWLKSYLQLSPK